MIIFSNRSDIRTSRSISSNDNTLLEMKAKGAPKSMQMRIECQVVRLDRHLPSPAMHLACGGGGEREGERRISVRGGPPSPAKHLACCFMLHALPRSRNHPAGRLCSDLKNVVKIQAELAAEETE